MTPALSSQAINARAKIAGPDKQLTFRRQDVDEERTKQNTHIVFFVCLSSFERPWEANGPARARAHRKV